MPGDLSPMDARAAELERVREDLRAAIKWRDLLAEEVARFDRIISVGAREFATLNGDFVKPNLVQLRRMLEPE